MSRNLSRLVALLAILNFSLASAVYSAEIERPIGLTPEGPQALSPLKTPEIPALSGALTIPNIEAVSVAAPQAALAAETANAQATPAQATAKMAEAVTAQAAAGLDKAATAGDSKSAAAGIQQIIEGRSAAASNNASSVVGFEGAGVSALSAATPPASAEKSANVPAPAASSKQQRKSYNATRAALAKIAADHGVVASMPTMPKELEAQITHEASFKNVIFSDIDDTLDKFNSVFSPETVKAIADLKKAGKTLVAITDRPDKAKEGSTTKSAFESFSSVPNADKAGMILATNGGGKIYQFDDNGEGKLIYSEPELDAETRAKVNASADAVLKAMESKGVGLKANSAGPFGHSIIFTIGTKMTDVKELAHLMESEMKSRGLDYEVEPREAKNPTVDPPYITFSKLNKSLAVRHVSQLKGYKPEESVMIGDSMYKPNPDAKASPEIVARAEALSGQKIPLTGNMVDRNMELAMPGALTIAVGGSADPRMANAWVMNVDKDAGGRFMGPVATRKILEAMASKRRGEEAPLSPLAAAAGALAIIAMVILVYGGLAYSFMHAPAVSDPNPYPVPNITIDELFGGR